jgi:hypothetical protein
VNLNLVGGEGDDAQSSPRKPIRGFRLPSHSSQRVCYGHASKGQYTQDLQKLSGLYSNAYAHRIPQLAWGVRPGCNVTVLRMNLACGSVAQVAHRLSTTSSNESQHSSHLKYRCHLRVGSCSWSGAPHRGQSIIPPAAFGAVAHCSSSIWAGALALLISRLSSSLWPAPLDLLPCRA